MIGVACTTLHGVVASLLIELGQWAVWAANGVAFTAAALTSYRLNTAWTFQASPELGSLLRFASVALLGLIVTLAITSAIDRVGCHYLVGIGAVVMTVPAMSFGLHRAWSYRVCCSAK
jgi:putative flippase GtrA